MEQPKIFADGIIWKGKRENAPEWIVGSIAVNAKKFFDCIQANKIFISEKGWINLDFKESKGGVIYCEINTWKPKPKEESNGQTSAGTKVPDFSEVDGLDAF
jgi:hypothetical protein